MDSVSRDVRALQSAIDGARLWENLMTFSRIGATGRGGVNRQAASEPDIEAHLLLIEWAVERGCRLSMDPIGNLFIRFGDPDDTRPPLVTGSHLDSQPRGGNFDGVYGVLAGLEVIDAMIATGYRSNGPIELAVWMNEEGSRFSPVTMGSAVYAGSITLDELEPTCDPDGITFGDALEVFRNRMPPMEERAFGTPMHALIEAHIEQGPLLEEAGKPVGVVTGVQGLRWFRVSLEGREAHSGTTPRRKRRDSYHAATRIIARLYEELADAEDMLRFTVGRVVITPGSPNTVPGAVQFTIDLRHPDEQTLDWAEARIRAACEELAPPCPVTIEQPISIPPHQFSPQTVDAVRQSCAALDLEAPELISGATHDAHNISPLSPAGMIFIRCKDGISHSEEESCMPEDVTQGARALAGAMAILDRARSPGGQG